MSKSLKKDLIQTTRNKALKINQDTHFYGSFAEIGAGQEVTRHFFQAGMASNTVAKSMSAYDKVFSDAIYGKGSRFVSEDRLMKMLHHEYKLMQDRLPERKNECSFFAFANTVATSSHEDSPSCHGWMGLRFQLKPGGQYNDVVAHVRMKDRLRLQQQEALGILGVNLVYASRFLLKEPKVFVRSLMDNLGSDRIEIEFVRITGKDVKHIDNRILSLELVKQGMTRAVMFDSNGMPLCPSDCLFKKAMLVQRGTFRPVTNTNLQLIQRGAEQFKSDFRNKKGEQVNFFEITMANLKSSGKVEYKDFLERVDTIGAIGQNTLVTNFTLYADLKEHLRKLTNGPIGIVIGASTLDVLFDESYYLEAPFGTMGAMSRLFDENTRIYVYPFNTKIHSMTAKSFQPKKKLKDIYNHFLQAGQIIDIENCDDVDTSLHSEKVRKLLAKGDKLWEKLVPAEVRKLIKKRKMFS